MLTISNTRSQGYRFGDKLREVLRCLQVSVWLSHEPAEEVHSVVVECGGGSVSRAWTEHKCFTSQIRLETCFSFYLTLTSSPVLFPFCFFANLPFGPQRYVRSVCLHENIESSSSSSSSNPMRGLLNCSPYLSGGRFQLSSALSHISEKTLTENQRTFHGTLTFQLARYSFP